MVDLIGPAFVGAVTILVVTIQVRSITKNISKQIKEQIDADRAQRFWNIRLDAIIELHTIHTDTVDILILGRIQEVKDRMFPIIMNIFSLFKGEEFVKKVDDAYMILEDAKDGERLPIEEHDKFAKLLLSIIDSGLENLGAFK